MTALLLGILLVLLLLNARVTYAIAQDKLSSHGQRISQFIFVWTIPFLGALLTLHIRNINQNERPDAIAKSPILEMILFILVKALDKLEIA